MTILDPNARKQLEDELDKNNGTFRIENADDPARLRLVHEAEEMTVEGLIERADASEAGSTLTYRRFDTSQRKPSVHDDSDR